MISLPVEPASQARSESPSLAVRSRAVRERDGFLVAGPLRMRIDSRPRPAPIRTPAEVMAGDEGERRDHIRRWARMMIVHLERADFHAPQEGYVATLERLRELLQREIEVVRAAEAG